MTSGGGTSETSRSCHYATVDSAKSPRFLMALYAGSASPSLDRSSQEMGPPLPQAADLAAGDDRPAGGGAGAHQQPGRIRIPRLGLEHLPDVALAVADGDHPRSGTGAADPLRQPEAVQPAPALAFRRFFRRLSAFTVTPARKPALMPRTPRPTPRGSRGPGSRGCPILLRRDPPGRRSIL